MPATAAIPPVLWLGVVLVLSLQRPEGTTGRTIIQVVQGGPGPSVVDLPVPGCWRFDLTWGSYSDTLHLGYATQ